MRSVLLPAVLTFLTSCASYDAQKKAVNKCHIDIDTYYLKEMTLEQLQCIEEAGKDDPNYTSLAERIEKKKKEMELADTQKAHEKKAAIEQGYLNTKLVSTRLTPTVGGLIRAEGDVPQEVIDETMFNFCTKQKWPYYKIIETKTGKTEGEKPQAYVEIVFDCVKQK